MAKPSKLRSFNSGKYRLDIKRFSNLRATHLVKQRNSFDSVKTSFRTLALVIALFRSLPKIHDHTVSENGAKTVMKIESFAFFDNSRFMTTK